jgi:putative endopeptidase
MLAFALASTAILGTAALAVDAAPMPGAFATAVQAAAAPKPQYGAFGFDVSGMDRSVAPGDDFFTYANGSWVKNTPMPADKATYGMFNALDDLSKERTRGIIEEQTKDPNSRIGNAYLSFMDTAGIEAKGLAPFEPWLNEVRKTQSKAALPALYAAADRLGISTPYRMFVGQDRKASDRYALNVSQGGLGMPDLLPRHYSPAGGHVPAHAPPRLKRAAASLPAVAAAPGRRRSRRCGRRTPRRPASPKCPAPARRCRR